MSVFTRQWHALRRVLTCEVDKSSDVLMSIRYTSVLLSCDLQDRLRPQPHRDLSRNSYSEQVRPNLDRCLEVQAWQTRDDIAPTDPCQPLDFILVTSFTLLTALKSRTDIVVIFCTRRSCQRMAVLCH
ncbi:hypothetical protein PISMIDRAFT_607261 [Pisolithus microcarpus 441]|uniref:Uncharacterized protein n=1 Tax=Pisolithus microcarpus 441 TaxID=765257 RepID=A0A0C9YTA2_9AGAM|nr:hypothetical protein PISMIDRAFT_607261 [Pisolithus microcarpus 441]